MKKTLMMLATLLCLSFVGAAFADTYVRGYYRKDGTYVQPHYRSSPDSSYNNNWSVKPNVNPHTGKQGTAAPTWNNKAPESQRQPYQKPLYTWPKQ